jgi:hypothetical protein
VRIDVQCKGKGQKSQDVPAAQHIPLIFDVRLISLDV